MLRYFDLWHRTNIFKTAEARLFKFLGILYDYTIVIHTKFHIDYFKNDGVLYDVSKWLKSPLGLGARGMASFNSHHNSDVSSKF